jgi:hypothetical protein
MLNPHYLQKYAQLRHDEFMAEVDRERLLRLIKSDPPSIGQRVRWRVGDGLIALGYKLKAQPQLTMWKEGYEIKG